MDVDRVSRAVVDRAVEQASARVRTVSALAGGLNICAAAIGYVALAVLADHILDGGLSLQVRRIGLAVAGLIALGLIVTYVVRPALRRINRYYAAWLLERAQPDLRHAVTTSLLLRHRSDVHAGVSSGLAFQAARAVRRMDTTRVVSDRSLRRAGLAVLSVIAAFGVYGVFAPKQVRPSVLRVFGADIAAPTQTSIEMIAPAADASVVVGTPVTFEAAVAGRIPATVSLEFSPDGLAWSGAYAMEATDSSDYSNSRPAWRATRAGPDVNATFWYRIRAGDARFDPRRIEVRPQPVVNRHAVVVNWPTYANRGDAILTDGPIDALIGSRAELTVRTNVPASDGRVVFYGANGSFSRQMSMDGDDPHLLRADWVVDRDLEYEVRFNDRFGAGNENPIRLIQRARGDQPPVIAQTEPSSDLNVASDGSFDIKARVSDDWGLSRVVLNYRGTRANGRMDFSGKVPLDAAVLDLEESVSVASLNAAVGDVVELYLEAADTRVNLRGAADPQLTRGPVFEIRVTGGNSGSQGSGPSNRAGGDRGPKPGNKTTGSEQGAGNQGAGPGAAGPNADQSAEGKPGTDANDVPGGPENPAKEPNSAGQDATGTPNEAEASRQSGAGEGPSDNVEGRPAPNSDANASSVGKTNPSEDSKQPGGGEEEDAGGPGGESEGGARDPSDNKADPSEPDAARALDRLIEKNRDALERIRQRENGQPDDERSGSKPNAAGDARESNKREEKPESDGGSEKPKNAATKRTAENKGQSGESDGNEDGAKQPPQGNQQPHGGNSNSEAGNSDQSGKDATKPAAKPKANGEDASNPTGERDADPSNPPMKSEPRSAANEGESPQPEGGADAKAKGDVKGPQRANEGEPDKSANGKQGGEQGSSGGGEADTGESKPGESDGQSNAVTPGPQAESNDPAKKGDEKGTAPRPAQGVGPTPKSGDGTVRQDAGPADPDGQFDGEGESDRLEAPMRDRARRAVDELERRLRDGGISDAELRDLGWSRAEAQSFVTRYRRLAAAAQRQRDGGLFSGRVRQGDTNTAGSGADGAIGVGRGMTGAVRDDRTAAKKGDSLRDATAESVPIEMRDFLDEYYRSMARQGEPKPRSDK